MIRFYTDHITPRLTYITDLVFREMLGAEMIVSADVPESGHPGPVICYRSESIEGSIHIVPNGLLREKGVGTLLTEPVKVNGMTCLFPVGGSDDWKCDPLATAFWLVTRYEEYLKFTPDKHGRFPASESLAEKYDFLREPVVNLIVAELRRQIGERWPDYELPAPAFRFIPTFDIDIAFAHLEKGWLRATGGFIKLAITGKFNNVNDRLLTLSGRKNDPYDNFGLQSQVLEENNKKALYFFLLGDYGPYDKNVDHRSERFRELISQVDKDHEACIHPSYASADDPEMVTEEISRLRMITGRPVYRSRQHFLRLNFPSTYRELLKNGITDDYSMGYANTIGFRAGIAAPFYFYDLIEESVTNLRVHPFIFMDTAMIDRMKLTGEEAVKESLELAEKVRRSGGEVSGVWHNYALCEQGQYEGWTKIFNSIVQELSIWENR